MDETALKALVSAAAKQPTALTYQHAEFQGLTATACFGRELVKFTLRAEIEDPVAASPRCFEVAAGGGTPWAGPRPAAELLSAGVRCRLLNLSGGQLRLARGLMGGGSMHAAFDAVVATGQLSGWCAEPMPTPMANAAASHSLFI